VSASSSGNEPVSKLLDEKIVFHQVRVDHEGKLLSWKVDGSPYHHVATLSWTALINVPDAPEGHKPYFTSSMFTPGEGGAMNGSAAWVHHPAGLAAMFIDTGLHMAAYTGDAKALEAILPFVDHVIAHGMTREDDAWSGVPYASSNGGSLEYAGANDVAYCMGKGACGSGDGPGFLEPDKVAELGHALARLSEARGERRYLDAAIRCANALAKHVKRGDAKRSPWPFRVDAKTGKEVRDGYSANVLGAIRLFDWMIEREQGEIATYRRARDQAWAWLVQFPMTSQLWDGYFEDIPTQQRLGQNPNQYTPLEVARFLIEHPDLDPSWRAHVEAILAFVTKTFTVDSHDETFERGNQHGAEVLSEQLADMAKMGSHTARFASVLARWHEATGDAKSRERAFRSFNWATYTCSDTGMVKVGDNDREGFWFSDGYGDWARHFVAGMAAVPAWAAPGENHLLRWTEGEVVKLTNEPKRVTYTTTRQGGVERLRLAFRPAQVRVGDRVLTKDAAQDGAKIVITEIAGSSDIVLDVFRGHTVGVVTIEASAQKLDHAEIRERSVPPTEG
jgi:hypothetical protein